MGLFKTLSPEEEAQRNEERMRQRVAQEAERRRQQEHHEYAEFMAGPAGRARSAFENGDLLYQASFNLLSQQHMVIPMVNAYTLTKSADPTAILNAICREGWELHSSGFAFLSEGEESRDKFLASGQHVAVRGKMMGYYVFKRCERLRVDPTENVSVAPAPVAHDRVIASKGGLQAL
jgi:hypothetical protein